MECLQFGYRRNLLYKYSPSTTKPKDWKFQREDAQWKQFWANTKIEKGQKADFFGQSSS